MSETKTLSVREARANISELLGRVAYGGERFIIAKKGRPMAELGPVETTETKKRKGGKNRCRK